MERERTTEKSKLVLSRRLQALVDMVTPGNRVVDVGCDHGFVAIQLVQQGSSPTVIAMDVRKGPLSRAQEHIKEWQLQDYIETRLSDGLAAYHAGEAETMVCAGMGGPLMMRILQEGARKVATMQELILQPQSELPDFRRFLREEGYRILEENILWEEEKYYFLFRVAPGALQDDSVFNAQGSDDDRKLYDKYGQLLLQRRDPILRQYLQKSLKTTEQIIGGLSENQTKRGQERLMELVQEKEDLQRALLFYA
ncbi:MAG: SAM-dependent methyltransferase [Lachnospiraceae bacterium]|nr:SAM-dependent methyltransferase [Lachnospiraceae bacterium]